MDSVVTTSMTLSARIDAPGLSWSVPTHAAAPTPPAIALSREKGTLRGMPHCDRTPLHAELLLREGAAFRPPQLSVGWLQDGWVSIGGPNNDYAAQGALGCVPRDRCKTVTHTLVISHCVTSHRAT